MTSLSLRDQGLAARIDVVDNHDQLYFLWKDLGFKHKTLLHFDAHSDFRWINPVTYQNFFESSTFKEVDNALAAHTACRADISCYSGIDIGNFLYAVFRDQMVTRWFWIVPDPIWKNPEFQKCVWKEMLDIYRLRTGPMEAPKRFGDYIYAKILGTEVFVTSIEHLPGFDEEILLSIDLDYLTSQGLLPLPQAETFRSHLPWIWPEDIVAVLKQKKIRPSASCISRSVEGGFTPIQYKFLGEVFRLLLAGEALPEAYQELKRSFRLRHDGRKQEALSELESFQAEGSFRAAQFYQKAQIFYELNRFEEAYSAFQVPAAEDSEYHSVWNSGARAFEERHKHEEALKEHRMMRVLTPSSLEPLAGQGRFFFFEEKYDEAYTQFKEVLDKDPRHFEANFFTGSILLKGKNFELALPYFEKAAEVNSTHAKTRISLAICLIQKNKMPEAKKHLREALRLGFYYPVTYKLLGYVYFRQKFWAKAVESFLEYLRLTCLSLSQRLVWN